MKVRLRAEGAKIEVPSAPRLVGFEIGACRLPKRVVGLGYHCKLLQQVPGTPTILVEFWGLKNDAGGT